MTSLSPPRAWSLFALALFFSSCRSEPEPAPLIPPALALRVEHYAGSPLAGPTSLTAGTVDAATLTSAETPLVDCRVLYLEFMPTSALDPLAARTRLIAASRGADPVLSSIVLASGARVGVRAEAEEFMERVNRGQMGRTVELGDPAAAIPAGITAWFEATAEEWIDVPDSGRIQKVVSLHVSSPADASEEPSVLLSVEDMVAPIVRDELEEEARPADEPLVLRRELICLEDRLPLDGQPLVIVFRSPFGDEAGALVAVLSASEPADERRDELLALCLADVGSERTEREAGASKSAEIRTLASAFQALDVARFHRAGLVFLATNTFANLAEDLALSAEDETLAAFVRGVTTDRLELDSAEPVDPGWMLERRAFLFLANLQLEDPPLSPELLGMLLRHAGEVGRYPGLVRDLILRSTSLTAFRAKLIDENRLFLEDSNPGARVRALDWLATMDLAPAEFDPLAGTTERRKALAAARERREAAQLAEKAGDSQ